MANLTECQKNGEYVLVKKLRVLALTRYGRKGASSRIRFEQFTCALGVLGIYVETAPLLRNEYLERLYSKRSKAWRQVLADYFRRLLCLAKVKRFDLIWIEKELFPDIPACIEDLFHRFGVRYVVDYDDAIFHNYDLSTNPWRRFLSHKIDGVMRKSTLVVCGNAYLNNRAKVAGASKVEIVPTVIDLNRYHVKQKISSIPYIIGWVGSAATIKYLEIVLPALKLLAKEYPVQLHVVGAVISTPGLDIKCQPWAEDDEVNQIQEFDIGIMPLMDSPWERGKCGYKLIQYMACGLPVVASPVGVNTEIVHDGENGYLADTDEAWFNALQKLLTDTGLRQQMGAIGRKRVEEEYCVQQVAPRLAALLRAAAEGT